VWEQTILPAKAARAGAALLCPANLAPLAGRRNIVVLHDAAPLRFPNDFSKPYQRWQEFLLPRLAQGALRVIAPSEFSRGELIELCGADPDLVKVVFGGVPDGYSPNVDPAEVLEQMGIEGPYVLTVASYVKRKNLAVLNRVATRLAEEGVQLVAVGGGRPQFGPSGVEERGSVFLTGAVRESLLPSLYAGALSFVLPSIYEGFGLPVCEAMAAGTPVVCSNLSALPEAAGGAALLVDPNDEDQLEAAVLSATFDESVRGDLVERGLQRVQSLTWSETARRVNDVCSAACGWS
jgi:glycosyltransferase involved in cell wall biosynthesis